MSKKVKILIGLWNTDKWLIVKTEMSIYQSNANLDAKILLGKIANPLDGEIREIPVSGLNA